MDDVEVSGDDQSMGDEDSLMDFMDADGLDDQSLDVSADFYRAFDNQQLNINPQVRINPTIRLFPTSVDFLAIRFHHMVEKCSSVTLVSLDSLQTTWKKLEKLANVYANIQKSAKHTIRGGISTITKRFANANNENIAGRDPDSEQNTSTVHRCE